MNIDRTAIERELSAVRAQLQQAAQVLQQAIGAEKALNAMLTILDTEAAAEATADPEQHVRDIAAQLGVAHLLNSKSFNGAAQ